MSDEKAKKRLLDEVFDKKIIDYFYLDKTTEEVQNILKNINLEVMLDNKDVPFNASAKGWLGAKDPDGNIWIIKKVEEQNALRFKLCELGYLIDFELCTLSAPATFFKMDSGYYRATKFLTNGDRINGYDYVMNPLKKVLVNDLINRWLVFDENRNPQNYLVLHNTKKQPLIVAIDNACQDFLTEGMKIKGNDASFGWVRAGQASSMSLLKPDQFEDVSIADVDERLNLMMNFSEDRLKKICLSLLQEVTGDADAKTKLIVSNILKRRVYINDYFRKWFKDTAKAKDVKNSEYEMFGKSFKQSYEN
jgi:hypothetical protein